MDRVAVLAITKNGIEIGRRIKEIFPSWNVFAPEKLSDDIPGIEWFSEATSAKIGELFKASDAMVCVFALGAVIRLVTPHIRDKKTDPAVIVIDDGANFVISALSGHLGGANKLASEIAKKLDSTPVITTAADVNKTISVDLVGSEFGWQIDDDSPVTSVSAAMVNGEKIGVFQDAGQRAWLKNLPENVTEYDSLEDLCKSGSKAYLIVSDKLLDSNLRTVTYRPKTLIVGVGLHQDTSKDTIKKGLYDCLERFSLSPRSVARLVSIRKPREVNGLAEFAKESGIPVEYIEREELAAVKTPNPSRTVESFEGTPSVSEAAAILVSGGRLVVEKQKFPPDLTIAVARMEF